MALYPSADSYESYLFAVKKLGLGYPDILEAFRRMVFNVLAHNVDDHAKNFSFVMNQKGQWSLAPAYDLTFSNSIGGEHATTIDGEGKNPSMENILAVAQKAGIKKSKATEIAQAVKETVQKELGEWV